MANENMNRSGTSFKWVAAKLASSRAVLGALVFLGLGLAALGLFVSGGPAPLTPSLVGQKAPSFEFEWEGNPNASLSQLEGKVVLINFWANWCEPCLEEMETLRSLEVLMEGREFVLLMVHVGDEKELALKVKNLPRHRVFGVSPATLAEYGISGLPHTVLIDKKGVVRKEFEGPWPWLSPAVLKQIQEPMG